MIGMSAVCQSSFSSRAATYPETRGICTSRITTSGIVRKTVWTASTPSSAAMTSKPSRLSTDVTMRRRVGLSSAMTTGGMADPPTPDETATGLDELFLVELGLEQVCTCAGLEAGLLVRLAAARSHDDDGNVLPPRRLTDGSRQRESVHPRHLDVGKHEVCRTVVELGRAVRTVDCGHDFVARAFEDHAFELAHADGVFDDEDARAIHGRPGRRRRRCAHRGTRGDNQLTEVDEADDRAVAVDGGAADDGQPAEERAEV